MPAPSEWDLVVRFQKGDAGAFQAIVELHLDRVAGVARRFLSDEHEALDVTQEAFIALHRALPGWRDDARLFTWLYRTTLNLCLGRLRARRRMSPRMGPEAAVSLPDPAEQAELAQAIEAALESLSDRQREVFVLCHEEGVPLSEIAARLGLSLGAVKSHLHRALSSLRDRLRPRKGEGSSPS